MGVTRFCRVRRLKVSGCYWQCQNMLVKHIKCNIVVIHGHRVLICWLWGRRPSPWALPEPTVWPQSVRFGQRFAMVCMCFFLNDYERPCWSCKSIISYHLVSYSTELRTALEDWPKLDKKLWATCSCDFEPTAALSHTVKLKQTENVSGWSWGPICSILSIFAYSILYDVYWCLM